MKIGILTWFHKNYNYGGQLQAHALQRYVQSLGNDVEVIDYNQNPTNKIDMWIDRICRNYKVLLCPTKIRILNRSSIEFKNNQERYRKELKNKVKNQESSVDKFDLFMNQIPHTLYYDRHSIKKLSNVYDLVILGGDQIWNPDFFSKPYYGTWIKNKSKIISYSVSAGKDVFEANEIKKLVNLICPIPQISVREENFEKLLKSKLKRNDIVSVMDPVFLLDVRNWNDLAINPNISEKYIFTYLLNKDINSRKKIMDYAKQKKMKVITIPHARGVYNSDDEGFGDILKYDVGPLEFLGLIKNAEYVFTDSFHGTCFSIIFHKEFYVIENKKNNNKTTNERMRTVLNKSNLLDRIFDLNENLEEKKPIDYENIDWKLNNHIVNSKRWLKSALENV